MKKQIIALALVLVLSMAMLVPAFAAEQRACSHRWVDCGNIYATYEPYSDSQHMVRMKVPQICALCTARQDTVVSSYPENHTGNKNTCPYC